jgi:hypothetical protein
MKTRVLDGHLGDRKSERDVDRQNEVPNGPPISA